MSVQNGERLATKQDLEVLANKFSKGDLYSTDEKMIGQWIDGKPLYQCSYSFNSPSVDSTYTNVADLDDISYETLYIKSAFLNDTRNKTIYDIPLLYNLSYFGNIILRPESKKIQMIVNSSGYFNFPCVCTICYTKTTDSAISIGEATDYSTEEKIIGTWIDGKPLYQKTITDTRTVSSNDTVTFDISSLSVDALINGWVMTQYPVQTGAYELENTLYTNNDKTQLMVKEAWSSSQLQILFIITIQYTKSNS